MGDRPIINQADLHISAEYARGYYLSGGGFKRIDHLFVHRDGFIRPCSFDKRWPVAFFSLRKKSELTY